MEQTKKKHRKKTWKIAKGQYGYLAFGTKFSALRTLLYYGVSAAIFIMGWISTGEKLNLLTVVAVLGILPASKSLVNMIMFLRNKGCSKESYEQIQASGGSLLLLYDLAMTTYDKTYRIASLAIAGHTICGYTEDGHCDENAAQKHIEDTLKMDGHKNYTVKIFHDLAKYRARLEQLNSLGEAEKEAGRQEAVAQTLLSVSL